MEKLSMFLVMQNTIVLTVTVAIIQSKQNATHIQKKHQRIRQCIIKSLGLICDKLGVVSLFIVGRTVNGGLLLVAMRVTSDVRLSSCI
jgi:hypothetical protein